MNLIFGLLFSLSFQFAHAEIIVMIETNLGTLEAELNVEKAPISTQNFLSYLDSHFYNQTLIHRVVPGFVIQGGGLDRDMNEKPTGAPIANEAGNGLSNLKGTLGMARAEDVNSATAQFYINTSDNLKLDHIDNTATKFGYAVFGKIINGFDVVEAIEKVTTHSVGEYNDVPVNPILIISIKRKSLKINAVRPSR